MSDLDYCKMLEVPVNSCDVVIKPLKRKKKNLIDEVINKVNEENYVVEDVKSEKRKPFKLKNNISKTKKPSKKVKPVISESQTETVSVKSSKFDIISVQVVAIFALIVGIILTNVFWEDSGMNNLLKQVFGTNSIKNTATYTSFSPIAPSKSQEVSLENGIMTVSGGSIYSPCDGIVESVVKNDELYTVTIRHSNSFTSILNGLEYSYLNVNDSVYKNVPIGFSNTEVKVSMFDNDNILTGYALSGDEIVWIN